MIQIIWKNNDAGGKNAYLGNVKVATYHYNGIDSKNGKYRGNVLLDPVTPFKVHTEEEIKELVLRHVSEYLTRLGVVNNVREHILTRIVEMRRDTGGFPKGIMRWDNFSTGTDKTHLSDMDFTKLDDYSLVMLFERLVKRYHSQM